MHTELLPVSDVCYRTGAWHGEDPSREHTRGTRREFDTERVREADAPPRASAHSQRPPHMVSPSHCRSPPRKMSRSPSRDRARNVEPPAKRADVFAARTARSPPQHSASPAPTPPQPKPQQPTAAPQTLAPPSAPAGSSQDVKKTQIKRKRGWDMSRTGVPAGAPAVAHAHSTTAAAASVAAPQALPGPPSGPPAGQQRAAAAPAAAPTPAQAPAPQVPSPGKGWEAEVLPTAPAQGRGLNQQASLHSVPSLDHTFTSVGLV